ncbi:FliM/FliN family flagellar motor switch protein [Chitinimonas sp. BJB300]|uniref:FliM/FliN family flagellar motor switch protein n=1 Tax=Chitinimonas sp. BJB300 TaxID=1559339 RepID=UPI001E306E88|nr:FliM/FliN family flagellar motor switch protein [Chitinimonas sp. BJB300]
MKTQSTQNETHTEEVTQLIELPELNATKAGAAVVGANLQVIRNVKVKLMARLGGTELSVGELMDMKENAVLPLDRLLDDPVDLLLDGHVVARGQLVAVGDSFGIRVTELPKLDGQ